MTSAELPASSGLSEDAASVVFASSAVAALGAAFSGVSPTGTAWWDPVLAAGLAVLFVIASSKARRWPVFAAVAIATMFVGFGPWLIVSLVGCGLFAASVVHSSRRVELRAATGAVTVLALFHLRSVISFGFSAVLAGIAICAVVASAYGQSEEPTKARVRRSLSWVGAVVGVFLLIGAGYALSIRSTANAGIEAARAGIRSARAGDTQALSAELERAQVELDKAHSRVSSPLLQPLKLVPVVAQHLRSVTTAAEQGSIVAGEARAAAVEADIDQLTFRQGQFDLDLLSTMAPRLESAAASLANAVEAIEHDRSSWLVGPVDSRLVSLLDEVEAVLPEAELAAEAARVMPAMLGSEGERRYLMLFGSPGEAREFGGFVGGFAVLSVDDGDLDLVQAGSINDIVPIANREELDEPRNYPSEYVKADPAQFPQNLTSTPNIAVIARATQDVFPELFGAPIDGVVYVDPYALAAMTEITGPVSVEGIGDDLVGDDIVDFIFDGQYRLFDDRDTRFEAIGALAEATAAGFSGIDLPGPEELGRRLGPVARGGNLQVVTYDDAENAFLASVRLQRSFVAPETVDSFAVIHTNATESKLDLFLQREITYDVTVADDRALRAIVDVALRSSIPADAPALTYGYTDGTNEVLLSLYTPHELVAVTVDGEPHEVVRLPEFGFNRYALFRIPLPANTSASVRFELAGVAPDGPYRVGVWRQPLVTSDQVEIVYRAPGEEAVRSSRELLESWLFDPSADDKTG